QAQPPMNNLEIMYEWDRLDWNWETPEQSIAYETEAWYRNAAITGIQVDQNERIFVSVPRFLNADVPATLNQVVVVDGVPLLEPFPNWEMHDRTQPNALQNILGFHIDSQNRLWMLDMGWTAQGAVDNGQKIVVWDLESNTEIQRYLIPDNVASSESSFLNDIVVDEANEIAYISDSGNRSVPLNDSGIIVYDFNSNSAHRVLDEHPSTANDATHQIYIEYTPIFPDAPLQVGINGLVFRGDYLYWMRTTGSELYRVPLATINDPQVSSSVVEQAVELVRDLGTSTDGLAIAPDDTITITSLSTNAILSYDPDTDTLTTLAQDPRIIWPDTVDWSNTTLYFTNNHLHRAFGGYMDFDSGEVNFRIWRLEG
ncbi:MAG: L-dopachrome tautomerase-related protein, partial [Chloroflexota bacterium]